MNDIEPSPASLKSMAAGSRRQKAASTWLLIWPAGLMGSRMITAIGCMDYGARLRDA